MIVLIHRHCKFNLYFHKLKLFRTTYWTRHAKLKEGNKAKLNDVDGFDNIAMTTSDENNTISEQNNSVEKNYSVENGNRNIFRDPNLDKQEKDDEGKTEKC